MFFKIIGILRSCGGVEEFKNLYNLEDRSFLCMKWGFNLGNWFFMFNFVLFIWGFCLENMNFSYVDGL